ncbi:MAG: CRISPR-associated helicase Cas3' [Ruminococcus sp.]
MKYIAHKDGDRIQTLPEHLEGTAALAEKFAKVFGNGDWGYCCGMLHDIGKYSDKFQKKISEDLSIRVDHATAGAKVCLEKGGFYQFMSYCIAGHHAGLPDYGSVADTGSEPTLVGRSRKKIEDYQVYKTEITVPKLATNPFDPMKTQNPDFSLSVFIRMLYSCLVDADFLDTESFMKVGSVERDSGEPMDILLKKLENHLSQWLLNRERDTVNGRRTEILRNCLERGDQGKGLFRLTVPTGGGKTIASLAFALRHAVKHHMDRVIYVIPYTSIIEQNAAVFRNILGEQNVLENHYNVDYEGSEELISMQLAAENWDKPVVVTTNVQFFESLYANKSSKCRKLHNIANSVIVFDEVQMLPNDYLKPCTAMMEELVRNYGVSLVLCTATQPALKSFFQQETEIMELCPRMEEQFQFFQRATLENIGYVTEEELIEKMKNQHQVLCIVNTKKRAQALFQKLEGEGIYHLSTSMYPKHRRRVLGEIRKRLKAGRKCILISTSLVEAGVDLDFQSVYRQLAGVDSIVQAAGRCNREGKRNPQESKVSVFQFEDKEMVPGQRQQMDVTKLLLAEGQDLSSLDCIEKYFQMLYHFRGESLDKKKILQEFQNKQYNFAKVGKEFRLIEENTKTILIPKEEEADEILRQLRYCGYTKSAIRKAGQYCIQLYEQDFVKLNDAGMLKSISEDIEDFYELAKESQYTEEMGLNLNVDSGMAILM